MTGRARTRDARWLLMLAPAALAGCDMQQVLVPPQPALERMRNQARFDPYARNPFFPDRRAMRPPPEGTVDRGAPAGASLGPTAGTSTTAGSGDPRVALGINGDRYVTEVPIPLTRALLERGRDRFEIFCAACHGAAGDGVSVVARKMQLRKPPSLLLERTRARPAGDLFRILREGWGFMPSYAAELGIEDRWAVVAFLEALQRSQPVRIADLPAALQREAAAALAGETPRPAAARDWSRDREASR